MDWTTRRWPLTNARMCFRVPSDWIWVVRFQCQRWELWHHHKRRWGSRQCRKTCQTPTSWLRFPPPELEVSQCSKLIVDFAFSSLSNANQKWIQVRLWKLGIVIPSVIKGQISQLTHDQLFGGWRQWKGMVTHRKGDKNGIFDGVGRGLSAHHGRVSIIGSEIWWFIGSSLKPDPSCNPVPGYQRCHFVHHDLTPITGHSQKLSIGWETLRKECRVLWQLWYWSWNRHIVPKSGIPPSTFDVKQQQHTVWSVVRGNSFALHSF